MIAKVFSILIVLLIYILALFGFQSFLERITGRKIDFITVIIGVACINVLFRWFKEVEMKGDIMLTIGLILMAIAIPYNMYLRINNPNLDYLEILFKMIGLN